MGRMFQGCVFEEGFQMFSFGAWNLGYAPPVWEQRGENVILRLEDLSKREFQRRLRTFQAD
jgi:hypothetical protein